MAKLITKSAADLKKMCEEQERNTQATREKWQRCYEFLTGTYFKGVSTTEGSYETYISNKPMTFGSKIIELLASMTYTLRIPLEKQNKQARGNISDVEKFGYGIMELADQRLVARGEKRIGDSLAFNLPIFGGCFVLEYIHKEQNIDDEEVTVPDIIVYDPLNSFWSQGEKGLRWYAHRHYADVEALEDKYPGKAIEEDPSNEGQATVYVIWDDEAQYTINGNEMLGIVNHELGYVPVHFQQCGSIPFIQVNNARSPQKDSFRSVFDANGETYEQYSRAMSYLLTAMSKEAKTPMVVIADGGTKNVKLPDEDPNVQGAFMVLDGQYVKQPPQPLIKPGVSQALNEMTTFMAREISNGSWADIAYGMFDSAAPVGTTNMMLRTALSVLINPQKAMDEARTWAVSEAINQYKRGDFNPLVLRGSYKSNRYFEVKVTPTQIKDDWVLECKHRLVPPQDELTNVNIAAQLRDRGLMSTEMIMDRYEGIEDTDVELERMALERARRNPVFELQSQIHALEKEDPVGNAKSITLGYGMLDYIVKQYQNQLLNPQIGDMGASGKATPQQAGLAPGIPGGTPALPARTATNQNMGSQGMNAEVPPEVQQEAQRVIG